MKNLISVEVLQIGTGQPLPSAETVAVNTEYIQAIYPTQDQSGGAQIGNTLVNPSIADSVYSKIVVSNGIGKSPTFLYSSTKVADLITAANA